MCYFILVSTISGEGPAVIQITFPLSVKWYFPFIFFKTFFFACSFLKFDYNMSWFEFL